MFTFTRSQTHSLKKSNPRELMQQFVKTLVSTVAFPGNFQDSTSPEQSGETPLHDQSAAFRNHADWKQAIDVSFRASAYDGANRGAD
jgi:hypothetical protein